MKKILILITVLVTLGFTGCTGIPKITDSQLNSFDGNTAIITEHDKFQDITTYSGYLNFAYDIGGMVQDSKFKVSKIIHKDKTKATYGILSFNQNDWLFATDIVFLFDGVPYPIKLVPGRRDVYDNATVYETYNLVMTDDFINKYISATTIDWKLYTEKQGTFTSHFKINKNDIDTGNFYRQSDKMLMELKNK